MKSALKSDKKSVINRGIFSTLILVISQIFVQIASVAVVSRLFEPEIFGGFAAALAAVTIIATLVEFSFGSEIIQRDDLSTRLVGSMVTVIAVAGFSVAVVFGTLAVTMGWIVGKLPLGAWLILLCILVLQPLSTLADSIALRKYKYRQSTISTLLSGAVGQIAAPLLFVELGWGIQGLAIGYAAGFAIKILMLIPVFKENIEFGFWRTELATGLHFSSYFTLARLFSITALQGDRLVLSLGSSLATVALYARSQHLMQVTISLVTSAFDRVLFPVFSRIRDDRKATLVLFENALSITNFLAVIAVFCAYVAAPYLIAILLGDGWSGAVEIIRILVPLIFFRSIDRLAASILRNRKMVKERALLQGFIAVSTITSAAALGASNIPLFCYSLIVINFIAFIYTQTVVAKYLDYPLIRLIRCYLPSILVGCYLAGLMHMFANIYVDHSGWLSKPQLPALVAGVFTLVVTASLRPNWIFSPPVAEAINAKLAKIGNKS